VKGTVSQITLKPSGVDELFAENQLVTLKLLVKNAAITEIERII